MKLCLFSVDESSTTYGVDAARVVEFLRDLPITRVPLVSPKLLGLLNVRGEVVPVFLPPRVGALGAGEIRHMQRQGSYLVLEGGDVSGRFAMPTSSVDLADGDAPEAPGSTEWLLPATTSTGRPYNLIDLEALTRNLREMVAHHSPEVTLAG